MRSKLELWKIVEENFDEYFYGGLCGILASLKAITFLSENEYILLKKELKEYGHLSDYFLGEKYDPAPRKEFIKKMIAKHSK